MSNVTITEMNNQMPLVLRVFENSLRSGYNLLQSLDLITKEVSEPVAQEIRVVLSDIADGTALPEALDTWLRRVPSQELDLMIAVIKVQLEVGGNLADKFNLLGQILAKRSLASA